MKKRGTKLDKRSVNSTGKHNAITTASGKRINKASEVKLASFV